MKKKEEKMIAPDCITPEEPKQMVIVIENKKAKAKFTDYVMFGAGFYVGFKIARTIKHLIVKAVTKK